VSLRQQLEVLVVGVWYGGFYEMGDPASGDLTCRSGRLDG
jgi:hypothetical protein